MTSRNNLQNNYRTLVLILLIFIARIANAQPALFQGIDRVGGNVYTTAIDTPKKILYIGGNFQSVNNEGARGTPVYTTTGTVKPGYPVPNSQVNVSIPDGNGGWYIGGQFTRLNNTPRAYLAQINADGSINTNLDKVDAPVRSLLLSNDTLLVGGDFMHVGSDIHNVSGVITDLDGIVLHEFNFGNPSTEFINSIAPDGTGGWFIAGSFKSINAATRNNIAQLNANGTLTGWTIEVDDDINQVKVIDTYVFVSGSFTTVNGQARAGFAVLDKSTGNLLPILANLETGRTVSSFLITGDLLVIGGNFDKINGETRNGIAFIQLSTGQLLPASITPNTAIINSLQVYNNILYFSGGFSQVNAIPRNGLAAWDLNNSSLTPFNPFSTAPNISSLLLNGSNLHAFGTFTTIGATPRNRIAVFDLTTQTLTDFNTTVQFQTASGITGPTRGMIQGNSLYVTGGFINVNDIPRAGLAALDLTTGGLLDFNPFPLLANCMLSNDRFLFSSATLQVGGSNSNKYLAALNTTSGNRINWTNAVNSYVSSILKNGERVIIAGGFSSINGINRNKLASFDINNGTVSNWNPNPNGAVNCVAVDGNTIYAGGAFTNIGGQTRNRIAALEDVTGTATAWNPNANNTVNTLLVHNSTVYTGGTFTLIGGQTRNRLAALNTGTGLADAWNPNSTGAIQCLAMKGDTLFTGGSAGLSGQFASSVYAFNINTGALLSYNVQSASAVQTISVNDSLIYLGGSFGFIGGLPRSNMAAIDLRTGQVTSWNPVANGEVRSLAIYNGKLYACGLFTSISGQARSRIAAFDLATGNLNAWAIPNFSSGSFYTMAHSGNTVYVGGAVNGATTALNPFLPRANLFSFDLTTGSILPWAPAMNSTFTVFSLLIKNNTLYAGGSFNLINGITRNRLASFDLATGNLTSWDPDLNGRIWSLDAAGDTLIAGGEFTTVGGTPRNRLAAIDMHTGAPTSFNPGMNADVRSVRVFGNSLYIQGTYTQADGQSRKGSSAAFLSSGKISSWDPNKNFNHGNAISPWGLHTNIFNDTAIIGGIYFSDSGLDTRIAMAMTFIDKSIRSEVNPLAYRAGEIISVRFDAAGLNNPGNNYTLELSDKQGNFNNPTPIGQLTTTDISGTITGLLPAHLETGKNYRLRINSNNPERTGDDNGQDITIYSAKNHFVNENTIAGDVFTSNTGSNSNPGTPSAPYGTPDYALSAAQPGDSIFIDAGTYLTPNINISKAISLIGPNNAISPNDAADKLVANTLRNTEAVISGSTFSISSNNITIAGLTLDAGNKTLISLTGNGSGNFNFEKNKIILGTGSNISLSGIPGTTPATLTNSGFSFLDNRFEKLSSGSGITFQLSNVKNVYIRNSAFLVTGPTPRTQLTAWIGTGGLVDDFHFTENVVDKANYNLFSINVSSLNASNNKFSNAQNGLLIQSTYNGSSNFVLENNLIEGNTGNNMLRYLRDAGGNPGSSNYARIENNTFNYVAPSQGNLQVQVNNSVLDPHIIVRGNKITQGGDLLSGGSSTAISFSGNLLDLQVEKNELTFTGINYPYPPIGSFPSLINPGIVISTETGHASTSLPANAVMNITQNKISAYKQSIAFYDGSNTAPFFNSFAGYGNLPVGITVNIHNNLFTGDSVSINNGTTGEGVNATCNWYDAVSAQDVQHKVTTQTVNYLPWLVNGTDADIVTAGFQPLSNTCTGRFPLLISVNTVAGVTCNGLNNGSISITVSGGLEPYSFNWSKNGSPDYSNIEDLAGLSPGLYSLVVTDAQGSVTSINAVEITEPPALTVNTTRANISCFGNADGNAEAIPAGGVSPYSFLWSNTATTATISNLAPGLYAVTVTDANGCTATASTIITEPPVLTASASSTPASTYLTADGSATVNPSGGIPPYQYSWSNGASSQSVSNVQGGNYTVTITDQNNCIKTITVTVGVTQSMQITVASTPVSCRGGNNGTASVSVQNGIEPYTYVWNTGAVTPVISGLAAGTYSVTVTDAIGNSVTGNTTVTQPATLLVVNTNGTHVSCYGGSNGTAIATASGGVPPYAYSWSNNVSSVSLSGLSAGPYAVTVSDAVGCSVSATHQVTQPAVITITPVVTNARCPNNNNGRIVVSASGGVAPYSYRISNGNFQGNNTFNNLVPGTYNVSVRDAQGCIMTILAEVTGQPNPVITVDNIVPACSGVANGSVAITVSGGGAPYQFSWSGPGNYRSTQEDIAGLRTGNYNLTVTNSFGCRTSITVFVAALPQISIQGAITYPLCYGGVGAVVLNVTGGTGTGYTFNWTGPNGFTATTKDISNVPAGLYTIRVNDSRNCQRITSFNITQPQDITVNFGGSNVTCFGGNNGTLTANPAGGQAPYSYIWNTGATTRTISNLTAGIYSVTVTAANGCTKTASITVTQPAQLTVIMSGVTVACNGQSNGSVTATVSGGIPPYSYLWNTGQRSATINNRPAGIYTVTVTDRNNCIVTGTYTITEPPALTAVITGTNISCFGANNGTAAVTASGGTPPYTYNWSNGQTSSVVNGLSAGNYTVTVLDSKGCQTTASRVITQPAVLNATLTGINPACFGTLSGSVVTAVSGGTAPYSYLWNNGSTTAALNNVGAGTYSTVITDLNGCSVTRSSTISSPSQISIAITTTNQACGNLANGTISATATGGVPPYQYSLDALSYVPGRNFNNLESGNYTVYVRDNNNCVQSVSTTVFQNTGLTVITNSVMPTSAESQNGSISISVSGGDGIYSYEWSGPNGYMAATQNISGLAPGPYVVVVTGTETCTGTTSAIITALPPLTVTGLATPVTCRNANNGSINLSISGGNPGYSFSWTGPNNFNATSEDVNNLRPGTYTVIVTDSRGISVSRVFTILEAPSALSLSSTQTVITQCGNTSILTATGAGGMPPYQYRLNNGSYQSSGQFTGLSAGTYSVYVRDSYGCERMINATVTDTGHDSYEPNNNLNQAANMPYLTFRYYEAKARIGTNNDNDWFNFTTQAGGSSFGNWQDVTVRVTHPSVNYNFEVYGNTLGQWLMVAPTSVSGNQKKYFLPTGVFTGSTYKVVINGALNYNCYTASVQLGGLFNSYGNPIGRSSSAFTETDLKNKHPENHANIGGLSVSVYPNPHQGEFKLNIKSPESGTAEIELINLSGQTIEKRKTPVRIGSNIIIFRDFRESVLIYKVSVGERRNTGKIIGPN